MRMPRLPRRTARIFALLTFAAGVLGALRLLATPDAWKFFLYGAVLGACTLLLTVGAVGWDNLPSVPNSFARLYKLVRRLSRAANIRYLGTGLSAVLILLNLLLFPLPAAWMEWWVLLKVPGKMANVFLLILLGATTGATAGTFWGDWLYQLHVGRRTPPFQFVPQARRVAGENPGDDPHVVSTGCASSTVSR